LQNATSPKDARSVIFGDTQASPAKKKEAVVYDREKDLSVKKQVSMDYVSSPKRKSKTQTDYESKIKETLEKKKIELENLNK